MAAAGIHIRTSAEDPTTLAPGCRARMRPGYVGASYTLAKLVLGSRVAGESTRRVDSAYSARALRTAVAVGWVRNAYPLPTCCKDWWFRIEETLGSN